MKTSPAGRRRRRNERSRPSGSQCVLANRRLHSLTLPLPLPPAAGSRDPCLHKGQVRLELALSRLCTTYLVIKHFSVLTSTAQYATDIDSITTHAFTAIKVFFSQGPWHAVRPDDHVLNATMMTPR